MNNDILTALKEVLPAASILTADQIAERYYHIWEMDKGLTAKALLLPNSTEEVATICRICNEHKQSIVIHGGLTNLVGSTRSEQSDIVISMERLNKIEEVDPITKTMTVQAGVILENIQTAAQKSDLLFPLNFGAKGTAQIGGCIASNAGGMRVIKYGMVRNQILGIEAVLANGTIVSSMKKIIKDNSGYDLKQLFIGSEGTLGLVTRAILKLEEKPRSRNCAFLGFDKYEQVVKFLKYIDSNLGGKLSCFEILWQETYKSLTTEPSIYKPPIPQGYKYYVLIESLGAHPLTDDSHFTDVLEEALKKNLMSDAAIANAESELQWFFNIREDVGILAHYGICNQQFDISIAIPLIGDYVDEILEKLETIDEIEKSFAFGHMGDGNIHFVVNKNSDSKALTEQINEIVYRPLKTMEGSISAEHGIGLHKKKYLPITKSVEELDLMRLIKRSMDSNNILNPGRIFDI